jgi:hypothetical protein
MATSDPTLNLRVLVDGRGVACWRIRLLRRVARALGVPVTIEAP